MCPLAPFAPAADMGILWSEEEIFMSLEKFKNGSPLPCNVTADVNPYQFIPSNLPEKIWYFCSKEEKDTGHGFWKATGEASEIFRNSRITGWRTTLEFYEGQAPDGQRTGWVMQEYKITSIGLCNIKKPKDSQSLCRVFLTDVKSPVHGPPTEHDLLDAAGRNPQHSMLQTVLNADSTTGQGSTSEFQEKNRDNETEPLAVAERLHDQPLETLLEFDYILRYSDDYLELDDLADPDSHSTSSVNSSFRTLTSEECFDSEALLRDLEEENQYQQGIDASLKFNLSASVKPKEFVMPPATLGSITSGHRSKSPTKRTTEFDHSLGIPLGDYKNEGTSNSQCRLASSGIPESVFQGEKKVPVGRMKKLKRKYFCFMPF